MSARRVAGNENVLRGKFPIRTVSTQEADGSLEVVNLCGKLRLRGESIINADNGVPVRDKLAQRHVLLRPGTPRAAMHPYDEWGTHAAFGQVQVKFQHMLPCPRVLNVSEDLHRLRILGPGHG